MLENFEAEVTMDRVLTPEEVRMVEEKSTALLGGADRGYVELRKVPETSLDYKFILRLKKIGDNEPSYICMGCGSDSCKPIPRDESYTCSACGCWGELVLKSELEQAKPEKESPLVGLAQAVQNKRRRDTLEGIDLVKTTGDQIIRDISVPEVDETVVGFFDQTTGINLKKYLGERLPEGIIMKLARGMTLQETNYAQGYSLCVTKRV
ncbi:MAG: hypothetical protein AABX17_04255 [Nanoarchaeota archaeon]